jgi:hypothetical protein
MPLQNLAAQHGMTCVNWVVIDGIKYGTDQLVDFDTSIATSLCA